MELLQLLLLFPFNNHDLNTIFNLFFFIITLKPGAFCFYMFYCMIWSYNKTFIFILKHIKSAPVILNVNKYDLTCLIFNVLML